jgi:hypothetical protein
MFTDGTDVVRKMADRQLDRKPMYLAFYTG